MLEQLTDDVLNAIAALRIVNKGCTKPFCTRGYIINLAFKRLFA